MTIVSNPDLQEAFDKKQCLFRSKHILPNFIFAYHGTSSNVIDSILKNNFDMKFAKRQAHGPGNYFSEYPDTSLGYGTGLIFCKILPGKEYNGSDHQWPGYQSKVVKQDKSGYSQMVIIQEKNQIIPLCYTSLI